MVFECFDIRPGIFRWRTNNFEDNIELFQLCPSSKKWLSLYKLGHYAPNRPNIKFYRVVILSKKEFRGAIPHGDHLLGHECLSCLTSQSEIAYL
jgi:hypothetical protein